MKVGEIWQAKENGEWLIKLIKRNETKDSYYFIHCNIGNVQPRVMLRVCESSRKEIASKFVKIKDEGYFEETLNNPVSGNLIKKICRGN